MNLREFEGKKVALIDRGFVVVDGRIVYPSTFATLVSADDKVQRVRVGNEEPITVFFVDALRCVRDAAGVEEVQAAQAPAQSPLEPTSIE